MVEADVREPKHVRSIPYSPEITTVCFMCTPSSSLKPQRPHDRKHYINDQMLQRAIDLDSKTILIENVTAFLSAGQPRGQHYRRALRILKRAGYKTKSYVFNSGVWSGASRPRVFILGHHFEDNDPLRDLKTEADSLPLRPLGDVLNVKALWHPPHNDNYGPRGDVSMIPAGRCYPCITSKCLKLPPLRYTVKPGDYQGGSRSCAIPTARTILKLH